MEVEPRPFVQLNNQGVCGSLGLNEIDYVDFFVVLSMTVYFQKDTNLDQMKEKERVEYLKKSSKKVVKQYGPDYYRKVKPLIIERIVIGVRDSISAGWMRREHKGRAYYLVEFPYDPNYEYFHAGFAARVYFWADTGIAFQVVFGNGWGFVEIDQPEKYKDQERIMEYERQPTKKQEE